MPSGIMLKVTGSSAMPGAPTLLPFTVYAVDHAVGNGEKEVPKPLNRDELSLYTAPPLQKFIHEEPEPAPLEEYVATVRKSAEPFTAWYRDTYAKVKPKVQKIVQFGHDTYEYVQSPPKDFYPRAGVIGATGVLGLFLGRGSRIKKLVYPAALMAASASLYYPEQAAAVAKSTGDSVYDYAVQSYAAAEKILNPQSKEGKKSKEPGTKP
ncbi:MICOS complex subunit MIC26-like [Cololabis saira]|uniref:MICOS complex subunit MIC26-like n=1 Tax=Cololabis saira TaxID=129043 RepID=UPI002AD41CEE|nr:MICOS complex subunit MIC26-like [Cololabis saira]